jgi:hypothetical protein
LKRKEETIMTMGNSVTSNAKSSDAKGAVSGGTSSQVGELGLRVANCSGNSVNVDVCENQDHKHICKRITPLIEVQNRGDVNALLLTKIRYADGQGHLGPWVGCLPQEMVKGLQNNSYRSAGSVLSISVASWGILGNVCSFAQIRYTLQRASEKKEITLQINKHQLGPYHNQEWSGSIVHRSSSAKDFDDEVGPGVLPGCGFMWDAKADPSNCTLRYRDNASTDMNNARIRIGMRTRKNNQTGTIFWKITAWVPV